MEQEAKEKLEIRFNDLVEKAKGYERAKVWKNAIKFYEEALKLKPGHPATTRKLNELNK